jgi:nucleotide-binding universal stress UspA family protein
MKIERVLLPIDFSPRTPAALPYAKTIACRFHASVTALHVLQAVNTAMELTGDGGGPIVAEVLAHQRDSLKEELESFWAGALRSLEVHPVLAGGDPASTIVEYARSNHIDLIVIPTRGCGLFRRLLLGSVTLHVLHHAPCPVLTTEHAEDALGKGDWELKRVLCALNTGLANEPALHWAWGLSSVLGARLSVVQTVLSFGPAPRELTRKTNDEVQTMLAEAGIGVDGIYVLNGSMADSIRSVARATRTDLVVIGHEARIGFPTHKNIDPYTIVRESPCPVVSV